MRTILMPEKRLYLSPPHMSNREQAYVKEVFESNFIAPVGPMLDAFESDFGSYTNIPHCLAVMNGTAAIHLALRVLGVKKGDEVWSASLTFIGGVSPITYQGATPVFFDSRESDWTIDCGLVEQELKKGRRPKAIIATDIYGQCADYKRLRQLCDEYEIILIADAAESLGSRYDGQAAGKLADIAAYSFNGNKIITASGGGMLASANQKWIDHARKLATQAREPFPYYEHEEIGYNYRMSNVMAAIGRGQLEVLDERVGKRREIFNRYQKELGHLEGVSFMPESSDCRSNRWLSIMTVEPDIFGAGPEDICLALEAQNIEARPTWKPMHMQPVFTDVEMHGGEVCEALFQSGLCLPSGTSMTDKDQNRVIEIIKQCQSS